MSSENTFEAILARMKSNLNYGTTNIEGTWTGDILQAVANEIARVYSMEVEPMYEKAFIMTATGESLDMACADYGVERNPATYAEGTVTIKGEPGTYHNLQVKADDIIFALPETFMITTSGLAKIHCKCTEAGSVGNVPAEAINRLVAGHPSISSVINETATTGGYDNETDESLRGRTLEKIRTPSTSGNIAQYKEWALDISGVENAQVFDLPRGNGTVDVVITAVGNTVPEQSVLDAVMEYIEAKRPVGADVQILAAEPYNLEISAVIVAKTGYTTDMISQSFYNILKEYLKDLPISGALISYIKMADLLFSCEGVEDISSYTLNGGTSSIRLEERCFPVAAVPEIELAE